MSLKCSVFKFSEFLLLFRNLNSRSTAMASTDKFYRLFEDSKHAEKYSKFRPRYPLEVKQRVLSYMETNGFNSKSGSSLMLDVGCGTGIVTQLFAPTFTAAWGIDISYEQTKQAVINGHDNEFHLLSPAETTCFKDKTFDLITVGQAWHWFDHDKFNDEVSRILTPNGFLAVFGYARPIISQFEDTKAILHKFHYETLGSFWSERRKLVDNHYKDMKLPFKARQRFDGIELQREVPLSGIIDYLSTQSAFQSMNEAFPGNTVLEELRRDLSVAIGGPDAREDFNPILDVRAPIFLEVCQNTD